MPSLARLEGTTFLFSLARFAGMLERRYRENNSKITVIAVWLTRSCFTTGMLGVSTKTSGRLRAPPRPRDETAHQKYKLVGPDQAVPLLYLFLKITVVVGHLPALPYADILISPLSSPLMASIFFCRFLMITGQNGFP
jgi:hypothetical protein